MKKTLLFLLTFFTISQVAQAQIDSGLVAKYYFNSSDANDDVGTNDGTVHGALFASDRFGNAYKAFQFIAANTGYIGIPNDSVINFTNADIFTITFWIKFSDPNAVAWPISKSETNGQWNGYSFSTNNANPGYCTAPGNFLFFTASGALEDACADTPLSQDTVNWNFITAIFDGAWSRSFLYVNGALQADSGGISGILANNADLTLGAYDPASGYFSGFLDDIRIYNRRISQIDIDSLYNEPNPFAVGIKEGLGSSSGLSIYPNPAGSVLQIHVAQPSTIVLLNILGQELKQLEIENAASLDVSGLDAGIYFVRDVSTGKTVKFSKQ